ncbi:MAG: pyridoxal phosphate-dependent aminotransferase [Vicinamibacteria bacterium]|nr:pyridoxal phosphate-dependent aminotransferase [Vicinamibacteria bacterium]
MKASQPHTLHLSSRVESVQVSPTVATAARATLLRTMGRDILDFSVGEPDQGTPERIKRAAAEAMDHGETRYVPSLGIPALRKAVADRYLTDDGVRFDPTEVAVTLGGKQAYALACEAVLNEGDEVVIPTPYWPTFSEAARILGAVPVFAPLDGAKGFAFDPDLIMKKVRRKTRLLVINSPSNPTGAVVSEKALVEIARQLKAKAPDAFLLYDDTYSRMRFVENHPRMLARTREILGDQMMFAGTASKTYCMTGWRIGWLLAPRAVINGVSALISHQTQCAASFAQFGAVEALTGPQDYVAEIVAEYRLRRDIVVAELNEIAGVTCRVPAGAFYAFPDIRKLLNKAVPDALTFAARLLDEQGVAVVAGEGFGCPGFMRISFARSQDELRRGLAAIRRFVGSLHYDAHEGERGLPIIRKRAKARA